MRSVTPFAAALGLFLGISSQVNAELIGHWAFDHDNGGETGVLDSSGNNYTGILNGGSRYIERAGGFAMQFDGQFGSYLSVAYAAPLALAGTSYSIAFWAKQTAGESRQVVIGGFDNGLDYGGGYAVEFSANGAFRYTHNAAGLDYSQSVSLDGINTQDFINEWVHYALVYDDATHTSAVYLNGELKAAYVTGGALSDRNTIIPPSSPNTNNALLFGTYGVWNDPSGYANFYQGALDDIRIYNNALSAGEVAALVPEPSMVSVLGAGLLGLIYRGRKQA